MDNELKVLKQQELLGQQFAVYGTPAEPLFLAKDVANLIGHSDVSTMMRVVDEDEKLIQTMFVAGQSRSVSMLTEEGLYEVLMQSRKPIAKDFKRGVKAILKEIRTNGGYIAAAPEETPEQIMAKALKVADETMKRQQALIQAKDEQITEQAKRIETIKPLADYTQDVLQSDTTYTLTQVAFDLGFRSVHTFTEFLLKYHLLYKQSGQYIPNSHFRDKGIFATRTAKYFKSDGSIGTSISTVVTEKGRMWLHGKALDAARKEGYVS